MSINEIKDGVVIFFSELIPATLKLILIFTTLDFLSAGQLHLWISHRLLNSDILINSEKFKTLIQNYFLSSVLPVLYIITLLGLTYLLNIIILFIGSLIPLRVSIYRLSFQKYHISSFRFMLVYLKKFSNTEIFNFNEFSKKELEINKDSFFEKGKRFLEKESLKLHENLCFLYCNLLSSSIFYVYFIDTSQSYRYILIFVIHIIFIIFFISKTAINFRNRMLLDAKQSLYYVVKYKGVVENVTPEEWKEIDDLFKEVPNKWWTVKFGYDFNWVDILKHFTFKFYRNCLFKRQKKDGKKEIHKLFDHSTNDEI